MSERDKAFMGVMNIVFLVAGAGLLGSVFGWKIGLGIFLIGWSLIPIIK